MASKRMDVRRAWRELQETQQALGRLMDTLEPGLTDPDDDGPPDSNAPPGDDRTPERRWQDHSVKQMGATNTMLIGLAGVTVAFVGTLASSSAAEDLQRATNWLLWLALALSVLSAIAGVILAFNRLDDFRKSADIARSRRQCPDMEFGRAALRCEARLLGRRSHTLLRTQATLWLLAVACIVAGNAVVLLP